MNTLLENRNSWVGSYRPLLASLAIAVALFVALASTALANKTVDSTIGTKSGTPALGGTFLQPGAIAVNQATGRLYVFDVGNSRIQRFRIDDNGTPTDRDDDSHVWERAWGWDVTQEGAPGDTAADEFEICTVASSCKAGVSGGGSGQISGTADFSSIAVDQTSGAVYVNGSRRVQKFDADGNLLRAWGRDVVASGPGNLGGAEICIPADGDVCKAGESGVLPGEHGSSTELTVGPSGSIYVAEGGLQRRVQKFTPAGAFQRMWGYDVVAGGPNNLAGDTEEQRVTISATGGTFTLSFKGATTEPINYSADAVTVERALDELSTLSNGITNTAIAVAGPSKGPWTVTFIGRLESHDQPEMTIDASGLTGADAGGSVQTLVEGAVFEICVPAMGDVCKNGESLASSYTDLIGPNHPGMFSIGAPAIATDSSERVYAADDSGGRMQRFNSDGTDPKIILVEEVGEPRLIVVDRSQDHVLTVVREDDESVIRELGTDGEVLDTHAVGAGLDTFQQPDGIALHEATGRLYLSSEQLDHWILVLDDDGGFKAGTATVQPATDVTTSSATLHGLVNPNGYSTTYQFEYSRNGSDWIKVGSPQSAGSGTSDVPVSATVEGLEANASYLVRIAVVTNFAGGTTSDEGSFTTVAAPPVVETVYPRSRTATSAILTGLLNANNSPTSYYFEWGETTGYGNKAPIPNGIESGGRLKSVIAALTGLEPETTYHYRLVAESSAGNAVGDDVSFSTRAVVPTLERDLEMVTPPFKVTRGTVSNGIIGMNRNLGGSSLDGDTFRWKLHYFPLLEETRSPFNGDELIVRRTAEGWKTNSLLTAPLLPEYQTRLLDITQTAASGDLDVTTWQLGNGGAFQGAFLPNEGARPLALYTRRDGTGFMGWNGWLTNTDIQEVLVPGDRPADSALFNDDGSWMVRWGDFRALLGVTAGADASVTQFAGSNGGQATYRQGNPPQGPLDLVNGCTGTTAAGDRTEIPSRVGTGASTDVLGVQPCGRGSVVSRRGAIAGGNYLNPSENGQEFDLLGPSVTAMAEDGSRIFFTSPDPGAPTTPKSSCTTATTLPAAATATGSNTNCPPQLYLRHYDESEVPTVRWISRPEAGMPQQQIGLLGPAVFQGASRDGDTVYFKTSSPLTAEDPNGTGSPGPATTGTASDDSWDLYRYEVPTDPVSEPGVLTRITGGPGGDADPNTNGIRGGAARFISDGGDRVYFVTKGVIDGADGTPPLGGVTTPGGTSNNALTRNLYLFDVTEAGADRWRFVARLPFAENNNENGFDACASFNSFSNADSGEKVSTAVKETTLDGLLQGNCVRGVGDGSAVTFITQGQLTPDDRDSVADIYLYDAEADELVRITAAGDGTGSYGCHEIRGPNDEIVPAVECRGQFIGRMKHAFNARELARGWGGPDRYTNIARDGSGALSVFFESRAQLLPADENVDTWDVYEWREGELRLISPGAPGHHSYFSGNSVDGRDAFFVTSARLDPREIDDGDYDVYDARVGGGFEYVPPPEPCDVLALECESRADPAPPAPRAGTGAPTGGNLAQSRRRRACLKSKVRRRGRCVKRKGNGHRRKKGSARKGGRR